MSALPAQLLESPLLVDYRDAINRRLSEEEAARRAFRARLGDGSREEFINGEVVPKVATKKKHFRATSRLSSLLEAWVTPRRLGTVAVEQALTEFPRNDYCPDLCFWRPERLPLDADGDQLTFPPPDLAVEILSASTERYDRGTKFEDYQAHGVSEYWIVDAARKSVEQYVNEGAGYVLRFSGDAGRLTSVAVAGFGIPVEAIFDDDACHRALQTLLAGP